MFENYTRLSRMQQAVTFRERVLFVRTSITVIGTSVTFISTSGTFTHISWVFFSFYPTSSNIMYMPRHQISCICYTAGKICRGLYMRVISNM
jgi:hypothetical protein